MFPEPLGDYLQQFAIGIVCKVKTTALLDTSFIPPLEYMCILTGTFAIGWTAELVDALTARGHTAVGNVSFGDPFALLLHRVKAVRENPQAIIVATKQDILPKHPHVEQLLFDLAHLLLSTHAPRRIVLEATNHDFFAKCISEGYIGTQHELEQHTVHMQPEYLGGQSPGGSVQVPSHIADTPELLREFVGSIL